MNGEVVRYQSRDEDSARWASLSFRAGDIVISARSKHGTTWVQMICALLVFQSSELPARLAKLSPWLDWRGEPLDDVIAQLESQQHRRFVKTHTPLDGIPLDPAVTYIVVARHPLDAAVSLYHQGNNLNRDRLGELTGQRTDSTSSERLPLHEWLLGWISRDASPREELDSLPGVMWHLNNAWARRTDPNVVLVHYLDLSRDLSASMHALATRLEIDVPDNIWGDLVQAATFENMRSRAYEVAPDRGGILKDQQRFFRHGVTGEGDKSLTPAEVDLYLARAAELASPELLSWLHRT